MYESYLQHHGVLGQKWGVRRYQRPDGTRTPLGKERDSETSQIRRRTNNAAKTKKDVDNIIDSLDKKSRHNILGDDKEYFSYEEGQFVVKRFLINEGNTPVAFLDFISKGYQETGGKENLSVAIAVRGDKHGKGYGYEVAKKGTEWLDKNMDKFGDVEWGALRSNEASQNLAKKMGFEYDKNLSTDEWAKYVRK